MKYRFVCATIQASRKGSEVLAPSIIHHPGREEVIISPKDNSLPSWLSHSVPGKPSAKKEPWAEQSDMIEKLKAEIVRLNNAKPKSTKVPASRITGMIKPKDDMPPEMANYHDILKVLADLKK